MKIPLPGGKLTAVIVTFAAGFLLQSCSYTVMPRNVPFVAANEAASFKGVSVLVVNAAKEKNIALARASDFLSPTGKGVTGRRLARHQSVLLQQRCVGALARPCRPVGNFGADRSWADAVNQFQECGAHGGALRSEHSGLAVAPL